MLQGSAVYVKIWQLLQYKEKKQKFNQLGLLSGSVELKPG